MSGAHTRRWGSPVALACVTLMYAGAAAARPAAATTIIKACLGRVPKPAAPDDPEQAILKRKARRQRRKAIKGIVIPADVIAKIEAEARACCRPTAPDPADAHMARLVAVWGHLRAQVPSRQRDLIRFDLGASADVNAFMSVGGHGCVLRGLLRSVGSDDELAFVLGHEVGHHVFRHLELRARHMVAMRSGERRLAAIEAARVALEATKISRDLMRALPPSARAEVKKAIRINRQLVRNADRLLERWVPEIYAELLEETAPFVTALLEMPFDQLDEHDADLVGLCLAHLSGYDASTALRFFKQVGEAEPDQDPPLPAAVSDWLRTHPPTAARHARLAALIPRLRPARAQLPQRVEPSPPTHPGTSPRPSGQPDSPFVVDPEDLPPPGPGVPAPVSRPRRPSGAAPATSPAPQ